MTREGRGAEWARCESNPRPTGERLQLQPNSSRWKGKPESASMDFPPRQRHSGQAAGLSRLLQCLKGSSSSCVKSGAEKSSGGDVVECGGGGRVAGGGLLVAASRHRRGLETETEQAQPPASEFQRPRNALQRRKAGQPGAGMCQ